MGWRNAAGRRILMSSLNVLSVKQEPAAQLLFCMCLWKVMTVITGCYFQTGMAGGRRDGWTPSVSSAFPVPPHSHPNKPQYLKSNSGLTEENAQLGTISQIGFFQNQANWGLVICSLTMLCQTHISPIPNWTYFGYFGLYNEAK